MLEMIPNREEFNLREKNGSLNVFMLQEVNEKHPDWITPQLREKVYNDNIKNSTDAALYEFKHNNPYEAILITREIETIIKEGLNDGIKIKYSLGPIYDNLIATTKSNLTSSILLLKYFGENTKHGQQIIQRLPMLLEKELVRIRKHANNLSTTWKTKKWNNSTNKIKRLVEELKIVKEYSKYAKFNEEKFDSIISIIKKKGIEFFLKKSEVLVGKTSNEALKIANNNKKILESNEKILGFNKKILESIV